MAKRELLYVELLTIFQKSVGLARGSIHDTTTAAFISGKSLKGVEGLCDWANCL